MEFITAPRDYKPCDLIYKDEVFAKVLPGYRKGSYCDFCCEISNIHNLIDCDLCSDVKYCSSECRENDADDHVMECGRLYRLEDDLLQQDMIQLLARVIFKIKGKSWHDIKKDILGNSVTFEDIDSHLEEMTSNTRFRLLFNEYKAGLKKFIGGINLPTDEILIKIIGKVKFSSVDLGSILNEEFCFGLDRFQHECIPNANFEVCGNFVKIWAIKDIKKSEKITICRKRILSASVPRSLFSDDSLTACRCTECSLPYGESVLTKILDKDRAYYTIFISEKVIATALTFTKFNIKESSYLEQMVDGALEKQIGVLGCTNSLHLNMLFLKGAVLEGTPIHKQEFLLQLARNMSLVFGDKYLELRQIYEPLSRIWFERGNMVKYFQYKKLLLDMNPSDDEAE